MRIYYLDKATSGKHKIIDVWAESLGLTMPGPGITQAYSTLEFDEFHNRELARAVIHYSREIDGLPDSFYIDTSYRLRTQAGQLVNIKANPHKDGYKLSAIAGLSQTDLETYIENNVTDLPTAKEFLKKLAAVELYLVKQTKLDTIDAEPETEVLAMNTLGDNSTGIRAAVKGILRKVGL